MDDAPFKIDRKNKKIELSGFNNLTKSLSFNLYDISYTPTKKEREEYIQYIDKKYSSKKLKTLLEEVVNIINASIINCSTQDYSPSGASATVLISEGNIPDYHSRVMHLDKSHLAAHTYPETNEKNGISTFRVDIDVSTCGKVSPLRALDFMMSNFDADIVKIDYRVRGFTRDIHGIKHYIDHDIYDITDFISEKILQNYNCISRNIHEEHIYHLKMMNQNFSLSEYLFSLKDITQKEEEKISSRLQKEMAHIFMGSNY